MSDQSELPASETGLPEATLPPLKKKRLRWWVYALLALLVFCLALGGSYSIWYWSAYSKLQAEIAGARQRGEPVWFNELEPPPVAPEENGALLLLQAASQLQIDTMKLHAAIARVQHYSYYGDDDGNQGANTCELEAAIQANSRALELARKALRMAKFRFDTDYHAASPARADYGDALREFTCLFLAESYVHMARDRPNCALNSIHDLLALVESLQDEPFIVAHNLRAEAVELATSHIGLIVGKTKLSADEFERLDSQLESLAASFQLSKALICERAILLTKMENWPHTLDAESDDLQQYRSRWSRPLLMEDQAATFRLLTEWAKLVEKPGRPFGNLQDRLAALPARLAGVRFLLTDVEAAMARCLRCRQSLIIARLGLRVDRHFRQHGRWPDNLAEVLDERMQELPPCHFSGLPLKWKTYGSSSGFVVFPPGESGLGEDGSAPLDPSEEGSDFLVVYIEGAPEDDPLAP